MITKSPEPLSSLQSIPCALNVDPQSVIYPPETRSGPIEQTPPKCNRAYNEGPLGNLLQQKLDLVRRPLLQPRVLIVTAYTRLRLRHWLCLLHHLASVEMVESPALGFAFAGAGVIAWGLGLSLVVGVQVPWWRRLQWWCPWSLSGRALLD